MTIRPFIYFYHIDQLAIWKILRMGSLEAGLSLLLIKAIFEMGYTKILVNERISLRIAVRLILILIHQASILRRKRIMVT